MNYFYIILAILMTISFVGMAFDQFKRRKESDEITKWMVNRAMKNND